MLSNATKKRMRHLALAGVGASFVLLYVGAVSLDSAALTLAGLITAAITAVDAWLAF
jgi:hypothetical protein